MVENCTPNMKLAIPKVGQYMSPSITSSNYNKIDKYISLYDLSIYVTKTGNDETGDGTSENPYLTIQKAVNSLKNNTGLNKISIFIGEGTYTENITITNLNCFLYIIGNVNSDKDVIIEPLNHSKETILCVNCLFQCFENLKIRGAYERVDCVRFYKVNNFTFTSCSIGNISLHQNTAGGLHVQSSFGTISLCQIDYTEIAILATGGACISVDESYGTGHTQSYLSCSSIIFISGEDNIESEQGSISIDNGIVSSSINANTLNGFSINKGAIKNYEFIPFIDTNGSMNSGKSIDFHSNFNTEFTNKIIDADGGLSVQNINNEILPEKNKIRNIQAGTSDMTAGTSSLKTGDIYLVYE